MRQFIPFEYPTTADGQYIAFVPPYRVLFYRREQLGLTQQQVADMARMPLRQYQRIEQGDSEIEGNRFENCLAICAALLLDPYELILPNPEQADASVMTPVLAIDNIKIPEIKKVGRKPIMRDIMSVYVNHEHFSIMIPCDVLMAIGSPQCIQLLVNEKDRRILIRPILKDMEKAIEAGEAYDVPQLVYDGGVLVFPCESLIKNVKEELHWDDTPYRVKCRLVKDHEEYIMALVDLNTAKSSDGIQGVFVMPLCLDDDE